MFAKVLIPLDSSDLAEYALQPAINLMSGANGRLFLLHVLEHHNVLIPEGPDVMGQSLHFPEMSFSREEIAARNYLKGLHQSLVHAYPHIAWQPLLEDGDPASRIVDMAVDNQVDLIVMSTHGYSGVTRWVLGSVAEKVLRHAPCPVMIIRSNAPIRQILIPLDGSPLAESSLPLGLMVAGAFGASVTLLRVDETSDNVNLAEVAELNEEEPGLGERYRQSLQEQVTHYLAQIQLRFHRDDLTIHTAVQHGKPAPAILTFAEEAGIDLIIMSTHGRTGLARWRYGSVAEKVLRGTNCAVLISRPDFH